MRRNKLYLILSIITILSLFSTAATCSFCGRQIGATSSDETKIDVEETTGNTAPGATEDMNLEETVPEETIEDITGSDNEDQVKDAPTISLEISEGPTYSGDDDVCWWRVEATVSGSPTPAITWSADYSNGSFGNTIAQVNLTRDNPEYTLTATATNSEGSATDDVDLSWGCDGEEDGADSIAEAEFIGEEVILEGDSSLSGTIIDGSGIGGGFYSVGDFVANNQEKGYLSFDISELTGINVFNAQLNILISGIIGNPETISPSLNIKAYDYGNSLDAGDFAVGGTSIYTFDISGVGAHDVLSIIGNDILIDTLQDAIDDGKTWYQIKLGLLAASNNDFLQDRISFDVNDSTLIINYSE